MTVYPVILSLFIFCTASVNSLLFEPTKRCIPTATVRGPCHVCVCTSEGIFDCRAEPCQVDKPANVSHIQHQDDLPEIHEGEKCIPGQAYRMLCNRCVCNEDLNLICTKMLCLSEIKVVKLKSKHKQKHVKDVDNILRQMKQKNPYAWIKTMPKGPCRPGRLYKKNCRRCFCDIDKNILCSLKRDACKTKIKAIQVEQPEDIRPPFKPSELKNLPTLPHAASKCEPGKTYKVDCNYCLCLSTHNLLCDKMLCLSFDDMNRAEADQLSGKPCKKYNKDDNICVTCKCVKNVLDCERVPDCIPDTGMTKLIHGNIKDNKPRLSLDMNRDDCVPYAIYRSDCNKCYCQEDGSLRCTLKTCLSYTQLLMLDKQRKYLEEHGL